jgi:nicotinamidase-related amidase
MADRKIYSSTEEIIAPEHSALIVWDVQNMLVNRIFNKEEFLQNLNKIITAARKVDVPIFFTKITPLPARFESKARLASMKGWGSMSNDKSMFELAVSPGENEIVINKNTASIFVGTNFELMARNAGIETLIFTGISTEIGVESSARDALNRGFYAVIARDAVSSGDNEAHERSLANMQKLLIITDSAAVEGAWSKLKS